MRWLVHVSPRRFDAINERFIASVGSVGKEILSTAFRPMKLSGTRLLRHRRAPSTEAEAYAKVIVWPGCTTMDWYEVFAFAVQGSLRSPPG